MTLLQVWVAAPYHFACPTLNHELAQELEADGWCLVWDSAPDDFKAAQITAQEHGAPVPFCPVHVEPERREGWLRQIRGLYAFLGWGKEERGLREKRSSGS